MKKITRSFLLSATLLISIATCAFSQQIKPVYVTDTLACFGPTAIKTARKLKERRMFLERLHLQHQDLIGNLQHDLAEKDKQLGFYRFQLEQLQASEQKAAELLKSSSGQLQKLTTRLHRERQKRRLFQYASTGSLGLLALMFIVR